MTATVVNSDSLTHLKTLPDNSVDAVVTDPPYGLGDCSPSVVSEAISAWVSGREWKPKGKGFMGKSWDAFVPPPELWREVIRVLKPGGHALIFAGSRTVDLMGISVRLAGFEVRDMLHWIYGSGFPKSLDVSKAIDKRAGAERKVIGEVKAMGNGRKIKGKKQIGAAMSGLNLEYETTMIQYTAPATDQAKQWEGWGTALKPAHEPVLLCRKPLEGAVVDNVERWGVGGLNVDGCRVGDESTITTHSAPFMWGSESKTEFYQTGSDAGRWPANILLDPEAASLLDLQAGLEASRFFYCAKAGREEKEAGLEGFSPSPSHGKAPLHAADNKRANIHPTVKPLAVMRWLCRLITPPNGLILDPFNGSGSTGCAAVSEGFNYLGIELDPEYCKISQARIQHWGLQEVATEGFTPSEPPQKKPSVNSLF